MRPRTVLLLAATFTLSGACACDSGPVTSDDGGVEAAIDGDVTPETCAVCATQATCTLSSTVASCVCNAGYVGDGRASGTGCTDVDECGLGGVNDCVTVAQNGTCTNTAGGFTCGCDVGYSGDGTLAGTGCTDFDECMAAMGDACVAMANGGVCVNTDGTYGCGCEAGYVGDGTLAGTGCADIDECTLATDDCYADVCTNTVGAFTCTALFGTSPFQNLFVRLDVNTGAALSATALPATIGTITGVNGIAAHPVTGLVYGIAKVSGTAGRVLFTMDPATLALTAIGNLGDNFSSLAFAADGTLYGVTGDGATVSETLYTIDIVTAAKTLVRALGNGADGEVIAFHADGLLYHWSGNGTVVMESLDPADGFMTITNIPTIGAPGGETFGAVYNPFTGDFLISNIASSLQHLTTGGAYTPIGTNAIDDLRGLVFSTQFVRHDIAPSTGAAAGGETITLRGIGVGTATSVEFGAANPATNLTVVGPDEITVTAPPGAGTVTVSAAQGTVMRAFYGYTYAP